MKALQEPWSQFLQPLPGAAPPRATAHSCSATILEYCSIPVLQSCSTAACHGYRRWCTLPGTRLSCTTACSNALQQLSFTATLYYSYSIIIYTLLIENFALQRYCDLGKRMFLVVLSSFYFLPRTFLMVTFQGLLTS